MNEEMSLWTVELRRVEKISSGIVNSLEKKSYVWSPHFITEESIVVVRNMKDNESCRFPSRPGPLARVVLALAAWEAIEIN